MKKILFVAGREFAATVMTKGFIIGMLFTPALLGILLYAMPRIMLKAPPKITGEVAIIDPTGVVKDAFAAYLTPQRFAERRAKDRQEMEAAAPAIVRAQARTSAASEAAMRQSMEAALGQVPNLTVVPLGAGADLDQEKQPLKVRASNGAAASPRLALVVVHPDAVTLAAGKESFGTYDLFVRGKLDDRLIDDIHAALRDSIVTARLNATGLDPARMKALNAVHRPESVSVTAEGERTTNEMLNVMLPMGFMLLLMMGTMTSGQYLLTTTVEEKSNRVVEVLLSAVSAMELMTGKILGQMAVGFVVLALYAGLGLLALISFATLGLLDPTLLVYLIVFYLLTAFTYSALMAAIGSAVNEMREAQTLMMPVMLIVMLPWILWMPVTRDPNSTLSVVLSFLPAMGNFFMLLRMVSTSPPPMWQPIVAIGIGAATVYASIWFAAKVFRVGLLMYGKPPTFATLIRWARQS